MLTLELTRLGLEVKSSVSMLRTLSLSQGPPHKWQQHNWQGKATVIMVMPSAEAHCRVSPRHMLHKTKQEKTKTTAKPPKPLWFIYWFPPKKYFYWLFGNVTSCILIILSLHMSPLSNDLPQKKEEGGGGEATIKGERGEDEEEEEEGFNLCCLFTHWSMSNSYCSEAH